ncbi:MAG: ANTAR domain-containing protein [Actinomycetota bacterium]|nr:ANTAR domain-containing protein [Actinomycetota bacterium]
MDELRVRRVLDALARHRIDVSEGLGDALCATGVDLLEVDGVGLTLQQAGTEAVPFGVSSGEMAQLEELERTLGEGPCVDAFTWGTPVGEPDLASSGRWPAFTRAALQTPARSAFGYPLVIGDVTFGALNLFSTRSVPLTADQHQDALALAHVAIHTAFSVLTLGGEQAVEQWNFASNELVVSQATGMIAVQLSVPVGDALARLRAHAFATDRRLSDVAHDVVDRRLRFEP